MKLLLSPAERSGEDIVLALSIRLKPVSPSVTLFCQDAYLGNGFSNLIIPCRRFRGGYCFGVVCGSFLFTSGRPAMDYGKLTKGALWSHLPPSTDQVWKLSVVAKIWVKRWLWHPGRSLKDYLWHGLKSANNGVKPHTDKNKQVADNRQKMDVMKIWNKHVFTTGSEY